MTKKMLIDAAHLEEMRVVIVDGSKLEELDIETSTKKQLKSNIYLAKVARVEPSLQAAFIDYGGNRHGFLAFNEIHPDYYQIPVADREALKKEVEEKTLEETKQEPQKQNELESELESQERSESEKSSDAQAEPQVDSQADSQAEPEPEIEIVTENEADEVQEKARFVQSKDYKIQEVIHRGQILLVQITKEERGNKGAALTTYLSLAGRYCVLMPNNARGGGVSRKITNAVDRKRLKGIISKFSLPVGMSVIVRTAGKERTSLEIKRDYEYLIKAWMQIREKTIKSSAPALIHEEGNIIKRALRDMYTRDISEVLIEGDAEYRMAKDFMKILTPSHAKKIKPYKDEPVPLFFRYHVESQLEAMHSNIVQLRSGGYLVIDQTEALVAIDVNSGRATKERNIEETAVKTNLEAAEEIARQLRLRDLAGLVVIDFIDMDEPRNNNAVERKMKESLKRDRARIQMGKITGFGLMELSRQRMHSSFIETSYSQCPHCKGKGVMRSTPSACIYALHVLEEESLRGTFGEIQMTVCPQTALYLLNHKRNDLYKIEKAYDVKIFIYADDTIVFPTEFRMERTARPQPKIRMEKEIEETLEQEQEEVYLKTLETKDQAESKEQTEPKESRREARSRRRRSGRKSRYEKKTFVEKSERKEPEQNAFDTNTEESDVLKADVLFEEGLKTSSKSFDKEKSETAVTEEAQKNTSEKSKRESKRRRGNFLRRDRSHRFTRSKDKTKAQENSDKPQEMNEKQSEKQSQRRSRKTKPSQEEKHISSSQEVALLSAPEEKKALKAPEEKKALKAPEEKKALKAPEEKKVLKAPEEKKALKAPEEKKALKAPSRAKKPSKSPRVKKAVKSSEEKKVIKTPKPETPSSETPEKAPRRKPTYRRKKDAEKPLEQPAE